MTAIDTGAPSGAPVDGRRRPVGYAPWSPRGATLVVLDDITSVLDAQRDYWPLTPRQVLYRLMGAGQATKADAERIGDYLVRGRRAGLIPWEAIGDGRTEAKTPIVYDAPETFLAEMRKRASLYRRDRQGGQELYLEVVVEATGAVEQVFRTTDGYGVPVYSGSGFVPVTALRQMVLRACGRPVPTVVLVLGDYDPAGRYIRERVAEDISAFADEDAAEIEVTTIALTEAQITGLDLIRAPMEAKKRRKHPGWAHDWTVELEAVSPADLALIVTEAIELRSDPDARQAVIEREAAEREALMEQMNEDGR